MAKQGTAAETHAFQAEVAKLLDIVVNSLYSEKEIFLRELISNASDACDRLRYESLTKPQLLGEEPDLQVRVSTDPKARTVTVVDNGIGMNREELIENLGTIAHSGVERFVDQLTGDQAEDVALIGQFGVGFYSAFMVADRLEVVSRRAGEEAGWRWESRGEGSFSIAQHEGASRGTRIVLHLRKGEDEFLEPERLRRIIEKYSDHIALPIRLEVEGKAETVNTASALWTRPRSQISEDQYKEFYHHVSHAFDDPWLTVHLRAEGKIAYSALLFVPGSKPFDLFHPDRKPRVKLYVKRVFITDDCEELVPPYLRFLRGVVDSDDLPLNISRETLQHNPVLRRIRNGLVNRVLDELKKKAEKEPDAYAAFWDRFGAVLKEGLYEDPERRERLLALVRFRSTTEPEKLTTLADYLARMREGQEAIYHISGEAVDSLRKSPQLEGFTDRGVEVLLLTDPVDEFWIPALGAYQDKPFKSASRGIADLDKIKRPGGEEAEAPEKAKADLGGLIALFKLALGDEVKDVRASERLIGSPVCLVADEGDLDMHFERLLRQHQRIESQSKRILELNPRHELVRALSGLVGKEGAAQSLSEAAHLLLDQARILEGEPLPDPSAFARRLAHVMTRGLAS